MITTAPHHIPDDGYPRMIFFFLNQNYSLTANELLPASYYTTTLPVHFPSPLVSHHVSTAVHDAYSTPHTHTRTHATHRRLADALVLELARSRRIDHDFLTHHRRQVWRLRDGAGSVEGRSVLRTLPTTTTTTTQGIPDIQVGAKADKWKRGGVGGGGG